MRGLRYTQKSGTKGRHIPYQFTACAAHALLPAASYMPSPDSLDNPKALQQLVFQLSHFNADVKIAALRQAVAFQDKAPLKPILEALLDGRESVRKVAAEAIEALKPWITDKQWLEALQRLLTSSIKPLLLL